MIQSILDFLSHPLTIWGGIISVYLIQNNEVENSRLYEEKIDGAVESGEKAKKLGSQIKLLKGKVESQTHAIEVMNKSLSDAQASQSEKFLEFNEQLHELERRLREASIEETKFLLGEVSDRKGEVTKHSLEATFEYKRLWEALNRLEYRIEEIGLRHPETDQFGDEWGPR